MSDELVKRAREVMNGVTPGPWRVCETTIHGRKYGGCWVEGPEVDDDGRLSGLLIPISGSGGSKSYTTRLVEVQGHDHNDENASFIASSRELVPAMADRIEELEAERDELRSAIFGSEDYASDLRNRNFCEMAELLHAAQKGGLTRAETAEIKEYAIAGASNGFENCGMCENILDTIAELTGGKDE